MLLPIAALLLTYALTAVIAILAAVALWRPLSILLAELCGTEERSRFWTVSGASITFCRIDICAQRLNC